MQKYQTLTNAVAEKFVNEKGYPDIVKRMEGKTPGLKDFLHVLSKYYPDADELACLTNFAWMCMEADNGVLGLSLKVLEKIFNPEM